MEHEIQKGRHAWCKTASVLLFIALIGGCGIIGSLVSYKRNRGDYGKKGTFPARPVNIEEANSPFDDYNSAAPPMANSKFHLLYSSQAETNGRAFNIHHVEASFTYLTRKEKINLTVIKDHFSHEPTTAGNIRSVVNTDANELGPHLKRIDDTHYLFMFTRETGHQMQIFQTPIKCEIERDNYCVQSHRIDPPTVFELPGASTRHGYATLNLKDKTLLFTSDANIGFDIFQVPVALGEKGTLGAVGDPSAILELNSPFHDKCPFFNEQLGVLLFASNRPGGFGGYDLWVSRYQAGKWSTPKNMGENVNSPHDEYRPISIITPEYKSDLMIFSSNRPGGKGGFDLYYVALNV